MQNVEIARRALMMGRELEVKEALAQIAKAVKECTQFDNNRSQSENKVIPRK